MSVGIRSSSRREREALRTRYGLLPGAPSASAGPERSGRDGVYDLRRIEPPMHEQLGRQRLDLGPFICDDSNCHHYGFAQ